MKKEKYITKELSTSASIVFNYQSNDLNNCPLAKM